MINNVKMDGFNLCCRALKDRPPGLRQFRSGRGSRVQCLGCAPGLVPAVAPCSGGLLWGMLLSNNLTWLERTQTDRPRALKLSVSIESVK